ncbi:MAG: hypothetical protein ACRENE_35435 [Polyangiaceae bacterium]
MRRTVGFLVLACLLAGSTPRDASADGAPCSGLAVEADAATEARWPGLQERIRQTLAQREDVGRCARIALTSRGATIGVEVSLPDGRSAHRSISRREDVVPVLEALLIVPSPAPQARPEPSAPPADAANTPQASVRAPPGDATARTASRAADEVPMTTPVQPSRRWGIDLSVLMGARVGDGQAGVGLGALSFLDFDGWLAGFEGRADRYEAPGGARTGALELALLGGRRLRFGTTALDLVAGPAVAVGGQTTYESVSPGGDRTSASVSNTVPRFLVDARLAFAALSTVHTFVGLDGAFGPASSPEASALPNAPRLPVWTAGVALGATVGIP